MAGGKELYSSFGFYTAIAADIYTAAVSGQTLDMTGFEAIQFVVNYASHASGGAPGNNIFRFYIEHGLASAAGVSAWSLVPGSQYIHSVYGGYSAADSGYTAGMLIISGQALGSYVQFMGYKKDNLHRYIRLGMSISGVPSAMWAGGIAIFGTPANWPVNVPV